MPDDYRKMTFDLKVTPSFNLDKEELTFETTSHAQLISREIACFKDAKVREVLIALGWTPPPFQKP